MDFSGIPNINSAQRSGDSGPAENRSVNILGGRGGDSFDEINRLVALVQGPSQNGGFSPNVGYNGTIVRNEGLNGWLPYILIGGGLLIALYLFE